MQVVCWLLAMLVGRCSLVAYLFARPMASILRQRLSRVVPDPETLAVTPLDFHDMLAVALERSREAMGPHGAHPKTCTPRF